MHPRRIGERLKAYLLRKYHWRRNIVSDLHIHTIFKMPCLLLSWTVAVQSFAGMLCCMVYLHGLLRTVRPKEYVPSAEDAAYLVCIFC
jgi:hypothetical protein